MLKQPVVLLSLLLAVALLSGEARPSGAEEAAGTGQILFIENVGQFAEGARFQVWGSGQTLWLAENAIWLSIAERSHVDMLERIAPEYVSLQHNGVPATGANLRLSFIGANLHPVIEPFERLATRVSYFTGSDPAQWHKDVPVWGGVRYRNLYPDVDLEIRNAGGQLAQRLVVRPGADLSAVRMQVAGAAVTGVAGRMLRLAIPTGSLTLPLPDADFPLAVTDTAGAGPQATWIVPRGVTAVAEAGSLADPLPAPADAPAALLYGGFLGGGSQDEGLDIVVDEMGSVYVTGYTLSGDFPTTPGAFDQTPWLICNGEPCADAFVVKLNPAGSELVYATFLSGQGWVQSRAIVVDGAGNAYVTGDTNAPDYPTTPDAFDPSFNGGFCYHWRCDDVFVTKLNPTGSGLVYSTFVGGRSNPGGSERGFDIALDNEGSVYVTGDTDSSDFPTTPGAFDTTLNNKNDVYVLKLNPTGSALVYATFLGGNGRFDLAHALVVDEAGSVYVTGDTESSDFPTTPAALDTNFNGAADAFVVKLNPAGSGLIYATFLGGSSEELGFDIALDGTRSAYVTGMTYSSDFPTTSGALDRSFNGYADAFVAKLSPAGSGLTYATFVGGQGTQFWNGGDAGRSIAVDQMGNAYVGGYTESSDFQVTPDAFDLTLSGEDDAFLVKINPAGRALAYATFLGGVYHEISNAIAVDGAGSAYMTGYTGSSDFPITPGAFTTGYQGGSRDAFVVRLQLGLAHPYSVWLPMAAKAP